MGNNEADALKAPVPPHIPADRVVDFDFYMDKGLTTDPHSRYAVMLSSLPEFFWTPRNAGHWVAIGEGAIRELVQDPDFFGNENISIPPLPPEAQVIKFHPLDQDPPFNEPYRQALAPLFSPKSINPLEPAIRKHVVDLIEKVQPKGGCEFVSEVGGPYPILIFMSKMGMDLSRFEEFVKWAADFTDSPDPGVKMPAIKKIVAYMASEIQRRIKEPGDDWISAMLSAKYNGRAADPEKDVQPMCNLLFLGGLDTVKNTLCNFMAVLSARPDLQRRLRDDPAIIPEAVEELLRDRGGTNPMRRSRRDGVFRGVEVRKGEAVLFMLPTVGIDPRFNDRPMEIDFDREDKQHLAFGAGPHRCTGSHLARLELRIFLEEWTRRIPEYRLKPGTAPLYIPNNMGTVRSTELVW